MQAKDFSEYYNEITLHLWKHASDAGRSNAECFWLDSALFNFWKLRIESPALVELFQIHANVNEDLARSLR